MKHSQPHKLKDIYGWAIVRHEPAVRFVLPPPVPFWQKAWYALRTEWDEVIYPSVLLALAIFFLELPFLLRR